MIKSSQECDFQTEIETSSPTSYISKQKSVENTADFFDAVMLV